MQKPLLWALGAAVFVYSVSKAPARDLGQWDDVDPLVRKWFREHTKDTQYPEIDLVVQRRFLSSLKDEIIEMLEDFPEQTGD